MELKHFYSIILQNKKNPHRYKINHEDNTIF
nr:MAG TPA: hypothetical protein [Caudoviricetes sp.]